MAEKWALPLATDSRKGMFNEAAGGGPINIGQKKIVYGAKIAFVARGAEHRELYKGLNKGGAPAQ